jgi:triosephosphate isomerase
MSRRILIAGNWKMNCLQADGAALAADLAGRMKGASVKCDMLVSPPFTLIAAVTEAVEGSGIVVGGQDCHMAEKARIPATPAPGC